MSIAVIIQFAALAVIAAIGVCVVYAIFEMREVYADQREKFLRAVSAVEELHKLQPQFISVLQGIEGAVDTLKTSITAALPEPKPENGDYVRLRKEVVSRDPHVRFSVLKDWISINVLAILHRASRGWNTANDLIGNIPAYLEAEAEVVGNCVLIIGTGGHAEKLAIPIRDLEPSSDLTQWFEASSNGNGTRNIPAVLTRSNGHFEVISKGTAPRHPH